MSDDLITFLLIFFWLGFSISFFIYLLFIRLTAHARLAGQARGRLQAPGLVQHVLFLLLGRLKRIETLAQHHVTGGAGAGFLASVLDLDAMLEQDIAERLARGGLDLGAGRAQRGVRQDG